MESMLRGWRGNEGPEIPKVVVTSTLEAGTSKMRILCDTPKSDSCVDTHICDNIQGTKRRRKQRVHGCGV
jgi:hypothetical protein